VFRNLPTLAWWLACLAFLIKFPVAVCVMGLVFLVSMPFKNFFLPTVPSTDDEEIQPLLGIAKYSVLQQMTVVSMVKAHIYNNGGKPRPPSPTKMLDIAPTQGV
jgi:hypothetical protein